MSVVFKPTSASVPHAVLRSYDDYGIEVLDLLRPSGRFWAERENPPAPAELHLDARRAVPVPSPAELINAAPADNWMATTRRSLARLHAWFLLADDPQRRLEAQAIATLAHQASVVHHITTDASLRRVILADEVGLGKTVEAGLIVKKLLETNRSARVLYLAPARLVRNVIVELRRLNLGFRSWVASPERDAKLDDQLVVASIHRAAHEGRISEVLAAPPWDMIIVDECHHLSDWEPGGGKPVAQYRLADNLIKQLRDDGRVLLMSGTPHQGHSGRFDNVLRLIRKPGESDEAIAGRVIYRTKEDVRDWDGNPVFPRRQINPAIVVDLGPEYQGWLSRIHDFFEPPKGDQGRSAEKRAAGWRAGQALQWAASSVQAGLGYLIRQAIRAKEDWRSRKGLRRALESIRPYRGGQADEPVDKLWERMVKEVRYQEDSSELEDIEDYGKDTKVDAAALDALLDEGVTLLRRVGDAKWDAVWQKVLLPANGEKVVLFAQPIETVTAIAAYLERKSGIRPAMIIGGQKDFERKQQEDAFRSHPERQFLVSSKAGGEGLNLQVARRLVHLDVPWNPMDMEQRVGRVHRFLSRRTILVDTIVAKDSRDVDMYACAREKLRTIASEIVEPDKFEALFGRVMALVPPEELQDVLTQSALGPLNDADRAQVAVLVSRGFQQWKGFHDRYSEQRQRLRALDAGAASWDDLLRFLKEHLGGTPVEGFSVLKFGWEAGEVVEQPGTAEVLRVGSTLVACGDFGGMPVTRADGVSAERVGTNSPLVTEKLRELAFSAEPAGPGHLRWPDDLPRPRTGPFGVVVLARQSVRSEQGTFAELDLDLHVAVVGKDGSLERVVTERGPLVRALLRATVRRDADQDAALVAAIQAAETQMVGELRRPTDAEREARVVHAVWPVLAATIA